MKLEQFFEKFELFADAPNAVRKMRELVLSLAIDGRLVSLDSSKWAIVPLVDVGDWGSGGTPLRSESQYYGGPIPWLVIGDLNDGIVTSSSMTITDEGLKNSSARMLPKDTLLIAMYGSIGKLGITGIECATNQAIAFCKPNSLRADLKFLFYTIMGIRPELLARGQGLAQKNISQRILKAWEIRLPPLAEQKRIVAKVDELMALCDRLEAQQQERDTRHAALARASLTRFAEAPTPANLDFLFHQSYPIIPADLRKAILSLAVQGQLIPQSIDDESASVALNNASVDLKRWAVAQDDQRFESPESWTWIRFAGVGEQRLGKMLDAHKNRGELKPYLRNSNVQWMRFELDDVKEMRVEKTEEDVLRLRKGDLLICEGGEPGRCAIWNEEISGMYFQKALHRVRPCKVILAEYLALNLQVDCQNDVLTGYFTGATIKHFTGRSLSQYPVPIPPHAEQRRIVAKVDQLMALVDHLETQLATSRAAAEKLMEAVVAELTAQE